MTGTKSPGPILTAGLFSKLDTLLLDLLRSLNDDEWEAQTIAPAWKVKDVAAHLLDGQLRKLSIVRDGYFSSEPISEDLPTMINRWNREGVMIYRRLSPAVLISLMEFACRENSAFHESLDPFAKAAFAVSWAGEQESLNWFDTAREFTERWHHQQQIRLAVNKPGIMTRELYHPVLDAFMRALPFHYRDFEASHGSVVSVEVSGESGGTWYLSRDQDSWKLISGLEGQEIAQVIIPEEISWRLFTKGIDRDTAENQLATRGDPGVALHVLSMLAIVG